MTNISKFEELQKRANLSTNNLDTILQDLEKKRLHDASRKKQSFWKINSTKNHRKRRCRV